MVELRRIANRTGCKYNAGKDRILSQDGATEIREPITMDNLLLNSKNIDDDKTVVDFQIHKDVDAVYFKAEDETLWMAKDGKIERKL